MTNKEKLQELIKNSNRAFVSSDLAKYNIHHSALQAFVKEGKLERIAHGVYITPDVFEDKMYILSQRRKAIIFSHETALFLHDLTDRDPISYSVTVPTGYNTKKLVEEGLTVFSVKKELYSVGMIEERTIFGNNVRTYDMERTICDILRSRKQMDIQIITDSVKRYSKSKDKDLNKLMEYAEEFKVVKLIRSYMEVLL